MLKQLSQVAKYRPAKILFADFSSPEEHAAKEVAGRQGMSVANNPKARRRWWDLLIEQVINAIIVGGCAGFSALAADVEAGWKVALYAFGMTFFFEMRKYRKL